MKRALRAVLVLLLLAAASAGGLALFVKVKFPPEKVRALLNEQARARLGREVRLGDVRLGLGGLSLRDFELSEAPDFSAGRFVASKSLAVRPFLLPLLQGRVVIKSVELLEPEIRLVRRKDGTFNFSDGVAAASTAPAPGEAASATGPAPEILVNRLLVSGGRLSFEDRGPDPKTLELRELDLDVAAFSLTDPFSLRAGFALGGKINGADVSGKFSFDGRLALGGEGSADIRSLRLTVLDTALEAAGTVRVFAAPRAELKVSLERLDARTLALLGAAGAPADASFSGKFDVTASSSAAGLAGTVDGGAAGLRATWTLKAKAWNFEKDPSFDAAISTDRLELKPGPPLPPELRAEGPVSLSLAAKGTPAAFSAKVSLGAKDLALAYGTSFAKPAGETLELTAEAAVRDARFVKIDSCRIALGPAVADIKGKLDTSGEGRVDAEARLAPFPVEELRKMVPALAEYAVTGRTGADLKITGPFAAPDVRGTLSLKSLGAEPVKGLLFAGLAGEARFSANDAAGTVRGKFNGADLELSFAAKEFARPDVELRGSVAELDAAKLLEIFSSTAAETGGPAASSAGAPAAPAGPAPVARARGEFRVGRIVHPNYQGRDFRLTWDLTELGPFLGRTDGTADFSAADGSVRDLPLAAKINKLLKKDASELTYRRMAGHFVATDGVLETQDFVVDSSQADIQAKGRVNLVTTEADLRAVFKLAAGSVGGSAADWFAGDDGRPTLEATIKGPLSDPAIQVDVAKAVKRAAEDLLRKGLQKLNARPPSEPPSAEDQKQADEVMEKGRKALEKLFRKR